MNPNCRRLYFSHLTHCLTLQVTVVLWLNTVKSVVQMFIEPCRNELALVFHNLLQKWQLLMIICRWSVSPELANATSTSVLKFILGTSIQIRITNRLLNLVYLT